MAIEVKCDCGEDYQVPEEKAGLEMKCAACGRHVLVPGNGQPVPGRQAMSTMRFVAATPEDELSPNEIRELARKRTKKQAKTRRVIWSPTVVVSGGGVLSFALLALFMYVGPMALILILPIALLFGVFVLVKAIFDYADKQVEETT